ncbi:hypothetical protein [Cystobacter fuscus]|uniref:hypothetical protein n=1 Tax=Cystobacter fuscus TaxID=43 RepID=UPI002B311FAD|nr:hypothetical protein F0U63_19445 [Cystobacter fuscus]
MFRKLISLALPTLALSLTGCGVDTVEQQPAQGTEQTATTGKPLTSVVLNRLYLPFYVPPRVGGDAEFDGNGPNMLIEMDIDLRNNGTELWVGSRIRGTEVGGDTKVDGWPWYHVFTAPSPIQSVYPVTIYPDAPEFSFGYRDYGHANDTYQFPQLTPPSRMVWQLSCVGDTDGKEAGTRTGCEIILHDLTINY